MLFAAIDIGSNAARLLFANVFEGQGRVRPDKASLLRVPIRLGLDVFETGVIGPKRVEMLMDTMMAFRLLIGVYQPLSIAACATAAMREAENGQELLRTIVKKTGIPLKIIDGIEEARIISSFNAMMIKNEEARHHLFVDVGGGSTELTLMSGADFEVSGSFRIGTIRLLQQDVEKTEWERLQNWLKYHTRGIEGMRLVGSGGNINKLTKLYGDYSQNTLSLPQLSAGEAALKAMSLAERISVLGLRPDRADVILPAARIYRKTMKWSGVEEIFAPKIGLVDGLVLMQYAEWKQQSDSQS
jgi:exopolyphosphatase/guanosine-5'-triphosphate,3'-diphosphate pyrophosphatase